MLSNGAYLTTHSSSLLAVKCQARLAGEQSCSRICERSPRTSPPATQARIHPEQRAADLSGEQVAALREAMVAVPRVAVDVDADSSRFPEDWIFHHRWAEKKAPKQFSFIKIGGRVRPPPLMQAFLCLQGLSRTAQSLGAEGHEVSGGLPCLLAAEINTAVFPPVSLAAGCALSCFRVSCGRADDRLRASNTEALEW